MLKTSNFRAIVCGVVLFCGILPNLVVAQRLPQVKLDGSTVAGGQVGNRVDSLKVAPSATTVGGMAEQNPVSMPIGVANPVTNNAPQATSGVGGGVNWSPTSVTGDTRVRTVTSNAQFAPNTVISPPPAVPAGSINMCISPKVIDPQRDTVAFVATGPLGGASVRGAESSDGRYKFYDEKIISNREYDTVEMYEAIGREIKTFNGHWGWWWTSTLITTSSIANGSLFGSGSNSSGSVTGGSSGGGSMTNVVRRLDFRGERCMANEAEFNAWLRNIQQLRIAMGIVPVVQHANVPSATKGRPNSKPKAKKK